MYPNTEFVETDRGGGTGGTWKKELYKTDDSLNQVLAFFERDMPGFTQIEQAEGVEAHYNSRCYDGWLLEFVPEVYKTCVSVLIYADPDNQSLTLINLGTNWIDQ